MPINKDTIIEANRKMLGKTNRTILFAKVNLDEYLNPEDPENERELTPSLSRMLPHIMDTPDEEFLSEVNDKLTVTSFGQFLDKFNPSFFYRVKPPKQDAEPQNSAADADADVFDADSGDSVQDTPIDADGGGEPETHDAPNEADPEGNPGTPQLEFALIGGAGWKKVSITADHPYILCLRNLIKQRVRQDVSTFRVDVDASLFAFKPKAQRSLMRRSAEDVQAKNDKLMLEAKRNPGSKDTLRALESYRSAADEFQNSLEDTVRVLPTVVYGLAETARELKRLSPGGGPVDTNTYQIEFGKNRALIASPKRMPTLDAAADGTTQPRLEQSAEKTEMIVRSLDTALDKIREDSKRYASTDIATVPAEKRFPIAVGKFMDQMIDRGMIAPLMGNLVATVLQNPRELAALNPDIKDVEYYHDMFLGVYSEAIGDFLRVVTPLFETIMGVYLLFNEFPADVRIPESMKPELIIANADLPDLFLTREEELKKFFEISNAQATNQFRNAISFVIVPNVAEFKKKRPAKKKAASSINLNDDLMQQIMAAQQAVGESDDDGYGRVTFINEMLPLLDWGLSYGYQVLFSPEERVRAGRAQREFFQNLSDSYAVETVVESESADAAIFCVPDFIIMPPDGKLITGRTVDGNIEVGVDVPELTVRSCYVAAGRLMANDIPAYVQRKLIKAKRDPNLVRMDVPGLGVDLSVNTFLGETDMPTDHFLNDGVLGDLLSPSMPFTVFTHVAGRSPFLSVPRTMRRQAGADGNSTYRHLHLFRQQVYLNRLLRAAHELGFGGSFPSDKAKAESQIAAHIEYILKWSGWYDPKLVNSFPSELSPTNPFTVERQEGNYFRIAFGFEQGLISEFGIRF